MYAVGHTAPSLFGDLMAAVLACGDRAAVSHASGAQLLSVVRAAPARPEITAFRKLVKTHGLPLPRTNIDRHGDKVDCYWPRHDLTVELVSFRFHATRWGFECDNARRRRSSHVAYTYGDVVEQPAATAADLRERLGL